MRTFLFCVIFCIIASIGYSQTTVSPPSDTSLGEEVVTKFTDEGLNVGLPISGDQKIDEAPIVSWAIDYYSESEKKWKRLGDVESSTSQLSQDGKHAFVYVELPTEVYFRIRMWGQFGNEDYLWIIEESKFARFDNKSEIAYEIYGTPARVFSPVPKSYPAWR